MKTLSVLKEKGLQAIRDLGIIVKEYPDCGLIVLNYDQIESPKTDPVVMECRGLILDKEFNVVSRSFDRFFNIGENECTFDPKTAILLEKVDGSLIKLYNYQGVWFVSTRGTAFAESGVNGWDLTFKDMVFNALQVQSNQEFQERCNNWLNPSSTYVCEITGVENRVVTRYNGYTLWLLSERDNQTGQYFDVPNIIIDNFGFKTPKAYKFNSVEDCIETARTLPDLQEGYVAYQDGVPICKIKSPAYVAVHHIRGEGLSPKRIAQLVLTGEEEEYLRYFPEDGIHIQPYVEALKSQLSEMVEVYQTNKNIESQKEFALQIKDYPFFGVLFQARKCGVQTQKEMLHCFNTQKESWKINFLLSTVKDKGGTLDDTNNTGEQA